MATLEDLLKMKIDGISPVTGKDIQFSPEFVVSIQEVSAKKGVRFIIHANGHNSDTLDFWINGNKLYEI